MCYMAASTAAAARAARKRPAAKAKPLKTATSLAAPARTTLAAAASARPALAHDQPSTTVGVRELRQNLSVYLDRVKQGAALQVTEHGRVVAVLRPVPPNASRYDILLALGLITPATKSIRDLPPPRKMPPGSRPMSEILDEMREDRF
jgi:prevent-host-death family protein